MMNIVIYKKTVKTLVLKDLFCFVVNIFCVVTFMYLDVNSNNLIMYIVFSHLMHILYMLRSSKNKQTTATKNSMAILHPLPLMPQTWHL